MPALLPIISLVLILASSVSKADDNQTLLFAKIAERRSLMKAVAADKWLTSKAIEDKNREAIVLQQSRYTGLEMGITVASNEGFYRAQISAAKSIQRYWFRYWRDHSGPRSADNLVNVIRPRLTSLGEDIISLLRTPVTQQHRALFLEQTQIEGLTRPSQEAIFEQLLALEYYPDRLTQVLDSGILRVGTTGDYAPFSESHLVDHYTGIDIDLAHNLADSLGVKVNLVTTSWPSLITDLSNNHFDIAMSGISRTLQRQQHGFFSKAYHTGGKTPIIRCTDRRRLQSLSDIDQTGNRIIVNPGGTNELYLDANIKQAEKILFADNRVIFNEIINGRADVMITDAIEVTLQSNKHPELCPAMPGETLTYQEKAILMHQDTILLNYIDLWLDLRQSDGTLQDIFDQHLNRNDPN